MITKIQKVIMQIEVSVFDEAGRKTDEYLTRPVKIFEADFEHTIREMVEALPGGQDEPIPVSHDVASEPVNEAPADPARGGL